MRLFLLFFFFSFLVSQYSVHASGKRTERGASFVDCFCSSSTFLYIFHPFFLFLSREISRNRWFFSFRFIFRLLSISCLIFFLIQHLLANFFLTSFQFPFNSLRTTFQLPSLAHAHSLHIDFVLNEL